MNNKIILNAINKFEKTISSKSIFSRLLKLKHNRLYNWLMEQTNFLNQYDNIKNNKHTLSIYERLYCLNHNLTDRPLCKTCRKQHVTNFNVQENTYKKWCSPSCQASDIDCISLVKKTKLLNYGDENFNGKDAAKQTRLLKNNGHYHDLNFCEKIKQTKKQRYGNENFNNIQQAQQTVRDKFLKNPDFWKDREKKSKQTKILNGHSPNWNNRDKFKQTILNMSNEQKQKTIKKRITTNILRYGSEYPINNINIKNKIKDTVQKKYGVDSILNCSFIRNKAILCKKNTAWSNIENNIDSYIPLFSKEDFLNNNDSSTQWKWKCVKCGNVFESRYDNGKHTICRNCFPINISTKSEQEDLIFDLIKCIDNCAIHHDRSILYPKELDILVKDKNIAFEYDGIYWHSDINQKNKKYHYEKTIECEKHGIQLIHIFENEWLNKKDIVISRIKNLLNVYDKTVFARKCQVRVITNDISREFQNRTHIQGSINAKVNLGLFYNNLLIAVMTFGKPRFNKKYEWELLRFSTELGYHIPGGAGKLLKFFERTYHPTSLISYADRRWSNGKLYKSLNFDFDHATMPNYWYIDLCQRVIELQHRVNFQKHKLKFILKDFNAQLSEYENMRNNGYVRIFDCGNLVFVKNY